MKMSKSYFSNILKRIYSILLFKALIRCQYYRFLDSYEYCACYVYISYRIQIQPTINP